jgi:hypothetical protein
LGIIPSKPSGILLKGQKTLLNKELQAAGFTVTKYGANEDECQIVKSVNCTSAVAYQHESMGKLLQLLVAYQTQASRKLG